MAEEEGQEVIFTENTAQDSELGRMLAVLLSDDRAKARS